MRFKNVSLVIGCLILNYLNPVFALEIPSGDKILVGDEDWSDTATDKIRAEAIADGSVDDAEYERLDGVDATILTNLSDVSGTQVTTAVATATALASDPADCGANQFANATAADGDLTCAAITDADVPDDITITETDPQVGTLTDTKWCYANSTIIDCTKDAPVLTEVDPQVGAVTNAKWCAGNGTSVECDKDAPVTSETDPQVHSLTEAYYCRADATPAVDCDVVGDGTGDCAASAVCLGGHTHAADYQPLEATLTDIADGTITENLVNTANPWANNEVADDITAGTAAALAADPANCAITECAGGITASGVAEACLDPIVSTEIDTSAELAGILGDEDGSGLCGAGLFCTGGHAHTDRKCANIDPTNATDTDWILWPAPQAITITGVDCIVDAATSVVMTLQECDANAANCVDIEAAMTCLATNTTEAGGSVDNGGIDAGDWLRVTRGAVVGTPTQATICWEFY